MADDVDAAKDFIDALIEHGIRTALANFSGESLMHCEECDEKIPTLRRNVIPGVRTCVTCQSHRELLQRVGVPLKRDNY
ncbi:TraR/DksA C4-type zinc finger protein [Obesumbacterium proteus]|uniref:TraR/DksA C4-type zinc finger protein n=1 Tax=Obesumbacterium proteus TaxID=82983 RepID=UPI001F3D3918|nr:TraR/DksA C4-type zinc finger protein [Obesumbacterium proteus]MCE9885885.1 TraR/DksA C4-type zinc finger protein [Obesumbacterium proteus]MCE9918239.1 TraR/DksA C4-type zinc finger protein [Obesumbacterium proteus]MCE9929996.1 TraR/DksA C4-type zinc finger protein [Obesumbacterium proteus]MCG2875948.1 TraR/DksA C4-type zinc finger protein [Obesumbacterium proteus]